jgi:hypothetical protein
LDVAHHVVWIAEILARDVVNLPSRAIDLSQPNAVATQLARIEVPLPVVFDRQASVWDGQINTRYELACVHDPILRHDHEATAVQMDSNDRLGWRLGARVAHRQARVGEPHATNVVPLPAVFDQFGSSDISLPG